VKRRLTGVALGLVILFALAQLVRPLDGKPKTDPSRTIQAHLQEGSTLGAVLDRSCGNCHTNAASWPWYARIAPVSWLIANGVREGRNAVNFSEWSRYSPAQQRDLLVASCRDASAGRMPDRLYTTLRPEARLTNAEIEAICAAAGQTDDRSAEHRQ
jgi:hypothetical protein